MIRPNINGLGKISPKCDQMLEISANIKIAKNAKKRQNLQKFGKVKQRGKNRQKCLKCSKYWQH